MCRAMPIMSVCSLLESIGGLSFPAAWTHCLVTVQHRQALPPVATVGMLGGEAAHARRCRFRQPDRELPRFSAKRHVGLVSQVFLRPTTALG
jgi:hypothetical protein